jgi:uncharacterized membrane-anchored protein
MGDFFARILGLGHIRGVPILAALLIAVLVLERRDRWTHQAYYWLAIIVVRTAATNLADFAASDMKQPRLMVMAVLAVMLVAALALAYARSGRAVLGAGNGALPDTGANYWLCMLIAGTLGTVLGDFAAGDAGLGLANASLVLSFVLGLIFYFGRGRLRMIPLYWSTIVVVRAAGTAVGDFLASSRGAGLGLQLSTAVTGLVFIAALLIWRERARTPQAR